MILYIENPKDSTKKLPELINEFSKVTGYKINIQKSVAFSYANNKLTEREIKKTIPENQDGGVGRHTAPPRTTRTDRKSNSKEVRHQGDKK